MTKQQQALVEQARQSLDAAKLLTEAGHHGFADCPESSRHAHDVEHCHNLLLQSGRVSAWTGQVACTTCRPALVTSLSVT
jgi:hypothetical protein